MVSWAAVREGRTREQPGTSREASQGEAEARRKEEVASLAPSLQVTSRSWTVLQEPRQHLRLGRSTEAR